MEPASSPCILVLISLFLLLPENVILYCAGPVAVIFNTSTQAHPNPHPLTHQAIRRPQQISHPQERVYIPSLDGGGIGAITVHPSGQYFAVAEKCAHRGQSIPSFVPNPRFLLFLFLLLFLLKSLDAAGSLTPLFLLQLLISTSTSSHLSISTESSVMVPRRATLTSISILLGPS